ncbi:MAG: translocation/assembly module TamB domain-containing protein [Gammaproteobacteria bacterium]|nr:translocation/assembly module TamB domain-containing protein [Gammaproteobacteria bacterium]
MRLLFRSVISLFLFVILSVFFLLYTNAGLRFTVKTLHDFMPSLVIDSPHGAIANNLSVKQIKYTGASNLIDINDLNFDCSFMALLHGEIYINKLTASSLIVKYSDNNNAKKSNFNFFNLPIKINLHGIDIQDLNVQGFHANKLSLELLMVGKKLEKIGLHILSHHSRVNISGSLSNRLNLSWLIHSDNLQEFSDNLSGNFFANGLITGSRTAPIVTANIKTNNLGVGTILIKKLILTIHNDHLNNQHFKFNVDARKINIGDYYAESFGLNGYYAFLSLDKGDLIVDNGFLKVPIYGVNLKHINITLKKRAKKLNYIGSLLFGNGKLLLNGSGKIGSQLKFNVHGNNLLIIDSDLAKIFISPDINVVRDKNGLLIKGSLFIPKANINPDDLRSVLTLPDDVVFVDSKRKTPSAKSRGMRTEMHINLQLGNKVFLNAFGLKGQLVGGVVIHNADNKLTTGNGLIQIKNATYTAFGQKLLVQNGSLTFSGGDITEPHVNAEAVRVIQQNTTTSAFALTADKLTAGIRIRGFLSDPAVTFFSDPAGLSNNDILSYIMTGQASGQTGVSNLGVLFQAAGTAMSSITGSLTGSLGFDTLGVESEDTENASGDMVSNSVFVVGKYLTPSLYFGYSMGLIDPVTTLRLRYIFGGRKNWILQTESSTVGTGIDLLYSVKRK